MDATPALPHRRSIRLKGHDYASPGAYFITILAHERKCLFGEVVFGNMKLSGLGQLVNNCWLEIPRHFPSVELRPHVLMPNHFHGIILIRNRPPQGAVSPATPTPAEAFGKPIVGSLPTIVRSFKSAVTRRAGELLGMQGVKIWHRNYFEHIIRNKDDFLKTVRYIHDNPRRWEFDSENPFGRPREELIF
ncbi:MAG TPA: transposase [Candidatus Angelobacter sp.]|nr:transposase [Candidatus Angelobacter sp.]